MSDPSVDSELDGDFNPTGDLNETDPDQAPDGLDPDQAVDPDAEPDQAGREADAGDDLERPATVLPGGFINPTDLEPAHSPEED